MLEKILNYLKKAFESKPKVSELEEYLHRNADSIRTNIDLEYYTKLFDDRQRVNSRFYRSI
jgi:hypothetical protein